MEFTNLPAYELLMKEDLPDVLSTGYLLRHKKSGARIMLLENEDENKVFNIAFRTTPSDSTGVAHIMEHTVLCGSRKFPAKDPFVELVKGSMNTFLNAMTYPDKTMFPVASCNDKDFANLMDVYLDAVLFPNIYRKEEIFRQEGWHYQLEKKEDPIVYNGVVYNEMKGAFSTPDDVVEREIMNSLFPDTTYHYESGGDPEVIPDLSYEEYLDFHRRFYHPSNSYIYLYGSMDFEERLRWMDEEYLSHFEIREVDSAVSLQEPFAQRKTLTSEYPVGQEDEESEGTYLTLNYCVGTSLDTRLTTAFDVLEYVLLDAPGAPLKQALLDAQIGKDILGSYDSGIYQPVFSIISKNAEGSDRDRFVELIGTTLHEIAERGLDEKAVRAAINSMEFKFREADYGSFPKGLMYGIDIFDSWLYDETKPFDYLKQLDDFAYLKEQVHTGYFENLIRTYLLDNQHVTLVVVSPKKGLTALMEEAVREKLDAYKASLTDEQLDVLVEKNLKLRAFQETPSTQEELEAIPLLTREDLKREAAPLKTEELDVSCAKLLYHDYQTNGIGYLTLLMDASGVPEEDLPYLAILKGMLCFVDTERYSYSELANEINLNTGGITAGLSLFPDARDDEGLFLALGMQVRTLYEKLPWCFGMIEEILFTSDLTQDKRLLEILRKASSRTLTRLTEAGSATAATRCMGYFSPLYRMNDCFGGITYYETVKDLEEHFAEKKEFLKEKLRSLLTGILSEGRLLVSFTGDRQQLPVVTEGMGHLLDRLVSECGNQTLAGPTEDGEIFALYPPMALARRNEGFRTPGKVQYVARCGNFRHAGYEYTGALRVLRTIMSFDYLWSNIRVVGGAYGCSGSFQRNGDTSFVSYRDPQLKKTIEVYEGIPAYLEAFDVDDRDMTKYVIGTISDMDVPMTPYTAGSRSMNAFLSHVSYERLQQERDEVLSSTQETIRALAPLAKAALDQNYVCVLGNEDRIESEKALFMETRTL